MLSVDTFETVADCAGALNDRSLFLGGGTLLMRAVNYGDQSFDRLVRTVDPGLQDIRAEGSRLRIGAGVRIVDVMMSRDLDFLHAAARSVGGPAIRNMATVGGNLFAPHPYGDFATALLALDATVHWSGGRDEPIETFFSGRDTARDVVVAVSVERPERDAFRFSKVSRAKPKGASVMSIAANLKRASGRLSDVRIAFGAMGPTPLRAKAAETALNGANLDEVGIAAALAVATDGLSPTDDPLASAWYRREVAAVHLNRLLTSGGVQ